MFGNGGTTSEEVKVQGNTYKGSIFLYSDSASNDAYTGTYTINTVPVGFEIVNGVDTLDIEEIYVPEPLKQIVIKVNVPSTVYDKDDVYVDGDIYCQINNIYSVIYKVSNSLGQTNYTPDKNMILQRGEINTIMFALDDSGSFTQLFIDLRSNDGVYLKDCTLDIYIPDSYFNLKDVYTVQAITSFVFENNNSISTLEKYSVSPTTIYDFPQNFLDVLFPSGNLAAPNLKNFSTSQILSTSQYEYILLTMKNHLRHRIDDEGFRWIEDGGTIYFLNTAEVTTLMQQYVSEIRDYGYDVRFL